METIGIITTAIVVATAIASAARIMSTDAPLIDRLLYTITIHPLFSITGCIYALSVARFMESQESWEIYRARRDAWRAISRRSSQ